MTTRLGEEDVADGYRVNMEKLGQLVNDLDHAADDITSANNQLANASGHDLGSPGIDSAADEFRERWREGISKIAQGAKTTSDALDAARATYAEVENEVAEMIRAAVPVATLPEQSHITSRLNGE